MQKRFLNLDGLRFMAAFVVLVCHIEIFKSYFNYKPIEWRFFANSAQMAVTFFFVLSGFLITYLLLSEKKKQAAEKISIPAFYSKRVLRIWPLYYLLVILCFFVLNRTAFFSIDAPPHFAKERLIGYSFFLPNYTSYEYGGEMYLGQTWSLGVEEFFYLFFPIAVYYIKLKNFHRFLLVTIGVFFTLSMGMYFGKLSPNEEINNFIFIYLDKYRIYSFCLGGLAAWFCLGGNNNSSWIWKLSSKKLTANALMLLLILLVGAGITFSFATQQLYSIFFAVLIFSFIVSEINFKLLNFSFMTYLGKISYGIYMFHPIAIVITFRIAAGAFANSNELVSSLSFIAITTAVTIALSVISYELYEKRFLVSKKKKVG